MKIFCPDCGLIEELTPELWRCNCGAAWEPEDSTQFFADYIDRDDSSLWRYTRLFGLDFDDPYFRMGAGWTPLLPANIDNVDLILKLENISPTGSFKDRGTEVMFNTLIHQGVDCVVDDSSGNAGASVSAYAARSGITAEIFVPSYASPAKRAQIAAYGSQVRSIPGPRDNAMKAALDAIGEGCSAAFHAYHPCFLLGQESVAWEIWEQLSGELPNWYVVPIGQGVHLLGAWLGFQKLVDAGLADQVPRLVGVQPSRLPPICEAFEADLEDIASMDADQLSVAEGLAITQPVRSRRILQAIRESEGICVQVSEDEIMDAHKTLSTHGFFVEPTSATALAALSELVKHAVPQDRIVLPLTGTGLKGMPNI